MVVTRAVVAGEDAAAVVVVVTGTMVVIRVDTEVIKEVGEVMDLGKIRIKEGEVGTKAGRVATTAAVIGAMTTSVVVINRVTEVAQCATISIRVADQRHTALIRVLADANPETQDGYRPSADKVL